MIARQIGTSCTRATIRRERASAGSAERITAAAAFVFALVLLIAGHRPLSADDAFAPVDTALVIAVDVSNSVDDARYRLQMQGIADALEDPAVVGTILNGAQGAILVTIVAWSDRPQVALDWMRIGSKADAESVAARIRAIPRISGEFTCVAEMLRYLNNKVLPTVPAMALRKVVDVSGDGADNCNSRVATKEIRDEIVGYGTVINGLPILEGEQALTLESWYRDNVQGGPGSFILPADSFADFGRAIRQKFIVEISGIAPPRTPPSRNAALPPNHLAALPPNQHAALPGETSRQVARQPVSPGTPGPDF